MPSKQAAYSLVEIMVTLIVVTLGVFPTLGMFAFTGSQVQQTAPYHEAVFLTSGMVEEVREARGIDPYFIERVDVDGYGTTGTQPKAHPFFEVLEDSAPPWGVLEPGVDQSIDGTPLEALTRGFTMQLTVSGTATAKQVGGRLNWKGDANRLYTYEVVTPVRSWTPLNQIDPRPDVPSEATIIAASGLQSKGPNTAAVATAIGADAQKLRSYLYLRMRCQQIKQWLDTTKTKVQSLASAAASPTATAGAKIQLAKLHLATTASLVPLLREILPHVKELSSGLPAGTLGSLNLSDDDRGGVADPVERVLTNLFDSSQQGIELATAAVSTQSLDLGRRLSLHKIIYDVAVFDSVIRGWPDTHRLDTYLDTLERYYHGRIPHAEHYFQKQRIALANIATSYPYSALIPDLALYKTQYKLLKVNLWSYPKLAANTGP
jgi:hypothetical protein